MARSTDYKSQRALAKALGTDGSLVGKWLKGKTMPSTRHLRQLPLVLDTPADYFSDQPRRDLLEQLVARVDRLYEETARGFEALGHQQHGLGGQEEDQEPQG